MDAEVLLVGSDGSLSPFHGAGTVLGMVALGLSSYAGKLGRMDSEGCYVGGRFDAQVALQGVFHRQSAASARRLLASFQADSGRQDAFSAGIGSSEPLDLTSITNEVLTQKYAQLTGLDLFPTDPSLCRPGASFYRQRRAWMTGEAAIHATGGQVPMAGVGRVLSGPRPTKYLVAGAQISVFDKLSADFAGTDNWRDMLGAANRAIAEASDKLVWYGDSTFDLWGILNNPYTDVAVSSTAITSSSTATDILNAISALAFRAFTTTKTILQPNAVVMSPKIWSYLSRTLTNTANSANKTLLEQLKALCPHITKWDYSWRLDGAVAGGPSSYDGMYFYSTDKEGPRAVAPIETTMLPLQEQGFEQTAYLFRQVGGVWIREPGSCLISWWSV